MTRLTMIIIGASWLAFNVLFFVALWRARRPSERHGGTVKIGDTTVRRIMAGVGKWMQPHAPCDCCAKLTPLDHLDSAPRGWWFSITRAADRGKDFDQQLCRDCYGAGFVSTYDTLQALPGRRWPMVTSWLRRRWFGAARVFWLIYGPCPDCIAERERTGNRNAECWDCWDIRQW